jgi:hypothetical protein
LLGALAGTICALVLGQWNMKRLQRAQEAFQQSLQQNIDKQRADNVASFAIATTAVAAAKPAASKTPAAVHPSGRPASRADLPSRETIWQGAQANVRKHLSDPVDGAWAARVTPALEHDLKRALTGTKGALGTLGCRSTSCLGKVAWPSLAEARAEVKDILFAYTRVNCARSVSIPPDANDEAAPVQVDVLYDCSAWKSKGSDIPALER